ncbi:MAG: YegP family protein [Kineosporiaceae bacterium]
MMGHVQSDELTEVDLSEEDIDAMAAAGEPVEVTGPPDHSHGVHFELVVDRDAAHRWRLVTEDGEILATSSATYSSRDAVRRALAFLTASLPSAAVIDGEPGDGIGGRGGGVFVWRPDAF